MKYILSIIIVLLLSSSYQIYNQEKIVSKHVKISIDNHIEPQKQIDKRQISKPETIIYKQTTNQKQTNIKTSKKDSMILIPKNDSIEKPQYLSPLQQDKIKSKLLTLINQERSSPVSLYTPLYKGVALRANEASQKWSHTRPNGKRWNSVLNTIIDISKTPHGENLAKYQIPYKSSYSDNELMTITQSIHQALMNSPTHQKVIVNNNYKKINIGIFLTLNNNMLTIIIVQHFIA